MPARHDTLKALRLRDLMPHHVAEVLLVSAPYEAFILEQDGQLTEQVFLRYSDLNLPTPPRFTHATSSEAAIELLGRRPFDLVITMTSFTDVDPNAFGRRVKNLRPGLPVVLLALDRKALHALRDDLDPAAVDGAFLWTGNVKILLAIINYVEDRENVDHDVEFGVRVIIVIEDSPSYYSSFLALLYQALVEQSRALYSRGVNEYLRQIYMNSRPKVLHAISYERGVDLLERYRRNLLAIISDMRIPRDGRLDGAAGLDFVHRARSFDPGLPLLLQSAEANHLGEAALRQAVGSGAFIVSKNSPNLLAQIRTFLTKHLGFGDFIFRAAPGGAELSRAGSLRELGEQLTVVPEESIVHHASHNHFSLWLMARSEFELAERVRAQKISDFSSVESVRDDLIRSLRATYQETHRGVISDFSQREFADETFSRVGRGSLGGKARGIAFLNQRLATMTDDDFGGLRVKLPKTMVVADEHFDRFLDANDLRGLGYAYDDDPTIQRRFLGGRLADELEADLGFIVDYLKGPLAVRSSSLLEDSMHQPMAGIYATVMLANNAGDSRVRLREICDAVKLVYASTFLQGAKAYLRSTGNRVEEEKMAVIIQELVGRRYGSRYYPSISGVAQSFNFYPVGPQRAEEGVVHLALGLGRQVVDGGRALRFSPRHPEVLPQLAKTKTLLDRSQRGFYALDLERSAGLESGVEDAVRRYDLAAAEEDGTLAMVGSVFSPDDQQIRDNLRLPGPRIVTFNNVLKYKTVALPEALSRLLEIGKEGLGCPVEIEFACDLGSLGVSLRASGTHQAPVLYVLQIRPFAGRSWLAAGTDVEIDRDDCLCASSRSLGQGVEDQIRDVVYVRRDRWRAEDNRAIAGEVGTLNAELVEEGRPYLLIGPGRWGTADEWLGIPVGWSQISNVRAIVEVSPEGYDVEPSEGTHFFQNITSLEIGYLSLPPGAGAEGDDDFLDWGWLDRQPAHRETEHLRRIRLAEPLTVVLDGRRGRGVIAKPVIATPDASR